MPIFLEKSNQGFPFPPHRSFFIGFIQLRQIGNSPFQCPVICAVLTERLASLASKIRTFFSQPVLICRKSSDSISPFRSKSLPFASLVSFCSNYSFIRLISYRLQLCQVLVQIFSTHPETPGAAR